MRRTERAAYRTKFYSNLSSPTRFDEEPDLMKTTRFDLEPKLFGTIPFTLRQQKNLCLVLFVANPCF